MLYLLSILRLEWEILAHSNRKSKWLLVLMVLAGIVVGGFFGYLAKEVPYLSWLNYGQEFGIGDSSESGLGLTRLNLGIITVTFGLTIKITISGIIGLVIAIFAYKKL